jgi:hypothetical protein
MHLSNIIIAIFWFIVASVHIYLMIRHFLWSNQSFPSIPKKGKIAKINGIPIGVSEAIDDFNDFIDRLNMHNYKTNRAHLGGYAAGFIASLIGFILSIQIVYS